MSSKIKVDTIENVAGSGNVSLGSGHNLVVPGNITGSGTATITGDLTVDTSSLKVNASNNFIGIGTASPQKKVHILDTTSDGIIIFDRNGTTTDHQVVFAHNYQSGGQSGGNYYGIGVDGSENKLVIAYDANSQASLSADAKVLIDSDGRVSMPNQPLAEAYYTANTQDGAYNATNRNYTVCKPAGTHVNVGNMYDASTGRFTVPVAGKYLAMVNGSQYSQNMSSYHYVYIRKNGTVQKYIYNTLLSGATWTEMSGSTVFDCAANDYIDFFVQHDSSTATNRGGWDINNYTKFMVYMLS